MFQWAEKMLLPPIFKSCDVYLFLINGVISTCTYRYVRLMYTPRPKADTWEVLFVRAFRSLNTSLQFIAEKEFM